MARPSDHPPALPCELTTQYNGKPVLASAVIEEEVPIDIPLELVPPEEAKAIPPCVLKKGGYFMFSDDYIDRHPDTKVARLIREFNEKAQAQPKSSSAGDATVTKKTSSETEEEKLKQIREIVKEAETVNRPLFRRQNSKGAYGSASYQQRDFYSMMDSIVEYII
ncbi:hypothetical protein, conserved [Angomonas deanei]|uniref:Uncharacterized protein n=1 Tax=Angomonas deanei TaxID=59799 RepID=A0A7G2C499_9TRYP|nr:hypothetical protein, conserved [Angomonas deanei]